jgi:anti-sigma regulatory factor (Ser/Thr protein kinase)
VTAHPAATRPRGYDHAAACYGSDDELLAVLVPFLRAGVEEGEPTLVSLDETKADLLRAAVPGSSALTFLGMDEVYARPAVAIRSYRELMAGFVADGARTIRIVGEVPPSGLGPTWDWWARYESAVNHVYDEFPLRSICAYDTRVTPRHVLDDVAMTHPFVAGPDGWRPADADYVDPLTYLSATRPLTDHPVQRQAPLADLVDPTPAAARAAVLAADRGGLPREDVEDFVLAVSELVVNASRHGRPPVRVRVWALPGCLVVTVHDTGPGIADPFAGLIPVEGRSRGGLGLWIAHLMCGHVSFARDEDGFTVRLTTGDPRPA